MVLGWVLAAQGAEPVLSREDAEFLRAQARRMTAAARLGPGQVSGKWRNQTPYAVRAPGANMGYPAFWVRDAVMMLGADLVPPEEVEGWIRLMASTVRGKDWQVHDGAVVPAWAVPDHINFDGRATFYPGTYDSGTKQGGKPFGRYPPLDDHFYFITAVYEHWRMAGSTGLFRSKVGTAGGEMELAELCERVYRVAPADRATGLVASADADEAKDWGFCDTVSKSGKLLFPSVLKHNAAGQLAELFAAVGDGGRARRYSEEARRLRKQIAGTFAREDGWLRSATGVGNQADVWGTAFAVWSGAVEGSTAKMASRALAWAYRDGTAVKDGLVRHILANDAAHGGVWEQCIAAPGTYQNGGYWGTPAGWYIAAVEKTDAGAARAMGRDYTGFLRQHRSTDGMSMAWEWWNPDTGKRNNPFYVATVALPYVSLKRGGLLPKGSGSKAGK